jgi:hypothetical protein
VKETLSLVGKVLGWVALFAALASLGFATDNPKVGVPAYLVFFLLVFGGVYLFVSRKKEEIEETKPENKALIHKIIGVFLILLALAVPDIILAGYHFPIAIYLFISLITFVLIVIGAFTVKLINKNAGKNGLMVFLGYLIFIVLSAIPAIVMIQYDSSYNALGLAYWSALSLTVFAWWGISLFTKTNDTDTESTE